MKVLAGLTFVVFAFSVSAIAAVPIPEPRTPQTEEKAELTGTTWEGPDGPLDVVRFVFEAGGALSYTYKNGAQFRNGTWTTEGGTVVFEVNQKYREFRGTVQGDTITGDSWNQAGEKWNTSLRRITPAK